MNPDKMKEKLIDYIDGLLPEAQRQEIARKIEEEAAWRQEYEQLREIMYLMQESPRPIPDEQLKHDFERLLQEEIRFQQEERSVVKTLPVSPAYWRYAAAVALLIVGVLAGLFVHKQAVEHEKAQALLQEREATRQRILTSLHEPSSASRRLSGILASQTNNGPDQEILTALIRILNHDDNTNVRLAALQVLVQYREEPLVYQALLTSLVTQDDPVVQISLINTMAAFKDQKVKENLQKIINDETVPDVVKDEAHVGLFQFS